MIFNKLSIPDVLEIQPVTHSDNRGKFGRIFCPEKYNSIIGDFSVNQINFSRTKKTGSLRGLHYQNSPHQEAKIISCLQGKIFDVAVDVRKNSPTYLKWTSLILDSGIGNQIYIPKGFAHGFQVLEGPAELIYLHDEFYFKEFEAGLLYCDTKLGITWPLNITEISDRDKSFQQLGE
jgi:dTDP-4-dehydrorhamnose 3,5-epimerase